MSGRDNVNVKPLVKHILSKELQLYFEKVCSAILDETNDDFRLSALSSLREDPGLHQLVPYFVQFISEKVTHGLKDLFILTQAMYMTESLIENKALYIDPYVCLVACNLPSETTLMHVLAGSFSRPSRPNLPNRLQTRLYNIKSSRTLLSSRPFSIFNWPYC